MGKNKILVSYGKRLIVSKRGLWADEKNQILSKKVKEILSFVQGVAAPGFTEPLFIKHYVPDFDGIWFRYMTNKRTNEKIGFLMSSFQSIFDPKTGKTSHIARCFPAFKPDCRNTEDFKYDRLILYSQVIGFYVLKARGIGTAKNLLHALEYFVVPKSKELKVIFRSMLEAIQINNIEVKINIESPSTFNDLMKFKLKSNLPIIEENYKKILLSWDESQLRAAMASKIASMNFIKNIDKPDFSVNISVTEKDTHIKNAIEAKNPFRLFFIAENPLYPNYAYKAVIPVDMNNIKTMIEQYKIEISKHKNKNFITRIKNFFIKKL